MLCLYPRLQVQICGIQALGPDSQNQYRDTPKYYCKSTPVAWKDQKLSAVMPKKRFHLMGIEENETNWPKYNLNFSWSPLQKQRSGNKVVSVTQ